MSTDTKDRTVWIWELATVYAEEISERSPAAWFGLAGIAAEWAERLARRTEARTLESMMEIAGRLAAAMASEDAEAIEGVEDEFRVSIDIPKAALPWREAMETE